ncbi:ribosome small subunit-dependent GTPase A [Methanolacinia paynteri]|uniref:ribosome small subunit-dependent GTPase A n=1 Tax=Methanolacinia paynteri TaxID=230356 RepID=UPI00064EC594|nr:ribosome small subunit-dependent GTPase A [Methanolacinia paynteri]
MSTGSGQDGGLPPKYKLEDLGWDDSLASAFKKYGDPYIPGRVSSRHKTVSDVLTSSGLVQAGASGALHRIGKLPAVGDFVVLLPVPEAGTYTIVDILPRKTVFTRGVPGKDGSDQVIAANIDTVFIVTAIGPDFNSRRIERYLAIAHSSGAKPVILVNKADLSEDPDSVIESLSRSTSGVPVIAISALTHSGLSQLEPFLAPGTTVALIGSSGVGKSTLINALLEKEIQATGVNRESDGKGRHKTTVRQLFILDNGALVIDNPGLREVGLGTSGSGMSEAFPDIIELAAGCRFSDCRHENEPGCAVRQAVADGILPQERLDNFIRLSRELEFQQEKAEIGSARLERKRWKGISKAARDIGELKRR